MRNTLALTIASALFAAATAAPAIAAGTGDMPMEGMMQKHEAMMKKKQGMMGRQPGGMAQSGGMMSCPMMSGGGMGAGMGGNMGGRMMGSGMGPRLPPGNEKLQLQMQAEIMQKVGEIIAKYAGQIQ